MDVDAEEPESSAATNDVDVKNAKEAPATISDSVDAADQKEAATSDVAPAETDMTKAEVPTVEAEKAPVAVTESIASTPAVVEEPAPAVEPPIPAAEAEVKPTESEAPKVVQSEPVSAVEPPTVTPNEKNGDIAPEADVKTVEETPVDGKAVAENDLKPATDIENNASTKLDITSSKYPFVIINEFNSDLPLIANVSKCNLAEE